MNSLFEKLFEKENKNDDQKKSKAFLKFPSGFSSFRKEAIGKQYSEISKVEAESALEIKTSFIYHGYDGVEAGIFIRNTSHKKVEIHKLKLGLMDENGKVLRDTVIDFKGEVRIEPNCGFYYEILFENIFIRGEVKNLQVVFSDFNSIEILNSLEMNMENLLPEDLEEEVKEFLEDKFYNIPPIRQGQFIIDPLLAMGDEDGINVILLFRNGSDKDVLINSVPLKIEFKENIPVYIGTFSMDNKGLKIEKNNGKLISIKIQKDFIMGEPRVDYSYNVKINV